MKLEDAQEVIHVNFPPVKDEDGVAKYPAGVIRVFHLNAVVSNLDQSSQLVVVPYNKENGLFDSMHIMWELVSSKYGHSPDERCAVWRYLFFTQFPGVKCVRYSRINYKAADKIGLISVSQIGEFGV